jgi:hypothetical protein
MQSCGVVQTGLVHIKGKYQEGPVRMKIDLPASAVWEKVISVIANNGLNVKIIDKSSGLIVSDPLSFISSYSGEGSTGAINNKNAYVVTTSIKTTEETNFLESLTASWNLRVTETDSGKATVSVLLYNIKAVGLYEDDKHFHYGKSTGNFEKWLLTNVYNSK